jgi:hypothetical protein
LIEYWEEEKGTEDRLGEEGRIGGKIEDEYK